MHMTVFVTLSIQVMMPVRHFDQAYLWRLMLEVSRLACSGQRLDTDMLEASSSIVKYFGLRAYRDRTVIKTNFTQGRTGMAHL
jgi:hypothetical protein